MDKLAIATYLRWASREAKWSEHTGSSDPDVAESRFQAINTFTKSGHDPLLMFVGGVVGVSRTLNLLVDTSLGVYIGSETDKPTRPAMGLLKGLAAPSISRTGLVERVLAMT